MTTKRFAALTVILMCCAILCAGCLLSAKAEETPFAPAWKSIRGSNAYGQFDQTGAPNGFVVMEGEKESVFGLMNDHIKSRNCWDGTCVYFAREKTGEIECIGLLQCDDGWIYQALRFYMNGKITHMDLVTSHGLLFENNGGQYTYSQEKSNRWGSSQKTIRSDIPAWVDDLFYSNVSIAVDEAKDGPHRYGSYTIDGVTEAGKPVRLLDMRVEQDGSVSIQWKDQRWSYDARANEYHPPREDSFPVQTAEDLLSCRQAADAGDANAQYAVGAAYFAGEIVEQSYSTALEYFTLAAEQENGNALAALGNMYENGIGVPADVQTAARYYVKAANLNNVEALYVVGSKNYQLKNNEKSKQIALDCFRRAAKQLYPDALCQMAKLYETGDLVKKSQQTALFYYIAAAKQGVDEAQYIVGMKYYRGDGVEESKSKAMPFLERAADLGDATAQYYTAISYYFGTGNSPSSEKAAYYFKLSADQGDMFSQMWMGDMYLYGKGVDQSYEQAEYYYKLSADQGYGLSAEALGDLYCNESSGMLDREAAIRYYQMAVDLGEKKAQKKLDSLLQD